MDRHKKRIALRRLRKGNPRLIIDLYEREIISLKKQLKEANCQGCARGFYEGKARKIQEKIRLIKEEKRFRIIDFNKKDEEKIEKKPQQNINNPVLKSPLLS